jgi:hypothetical protein
MEKEFNTIIEEIREIKMTKDEQSVVLNTLVSFMDAHPVRTKAPEVQHVSFLAPTPSPFFSRFAFSPALRAMAFVLIIAVIAGSGASFAAASALPGDVLYPVKVHINEPIASAFKITPVAKAEYAESLVETRLAEAQVLINRGAFTGARQAEAEAQIDTHMQIALAKVDALPENEKGALTLKADAVLFPQIARHRAVVATMLATRPLTEQETTVEITSSAPSSDIASVSPLSEETAVGTAPSATITTAPPLSATSVNVDTIDTTSELITVTERTITKARTGLAELRTINPEREEIRIKLEAREKEIALLIRDANDEFTNRNYTDSIALGRKAVTMVETSKDELAKLKTAATIGTTPGAAPSGTSGTTPTPAPTPTGSDTNTAGAN